MKKYWRVAKNTWDETVVYRLNFVMWRVRTVFQLLTIYFLWLALLPQRGELFGYTQSLMLTYILGTALIGSLVLSSRSWEIGDHINQGNLSNFLIRPMNYFIYWVAKDVGDKAMNVAFSIVELTLLFFILKPLLFLQTDITYLVSFLLAVILALTMWFFFNILVGLIGFWSPETWAPRFILMIVISFSAGGLFPLDILPKPIFIVSQLFPFPYLLYFPLKVYLGQLSMPLIWLGFAVATVWITLMYTVVNVVWKRGLKLYTAQGM